MPGLRLISILAAFLATSLAAPGAWAAAVNDPAALRIETFDRALVETMKAGPALGAKGRYRKLAPIVENSFDLPVMTRFAVGPAWAAMPEADHQALVRAFTRLSAASYAHNFNEFSGERFEVEGKVQTRGADKIVQSHLITPHGAPVALTYRMRQTPEGWRIIDVYYGAISQLTTRRSDFAAPLAAGGAKGLLMHLEALSESLLR